MKSVGIIDVGSNTIKLLVAKTGTDCPVEQIDFVVEETRIGEGMTGNPPIIDPDAIRRGSEAIARLVKVGESCDALCIVATAAVRDATNKQAFVNAVESLCGHELRILSGDEEAIFISRGIQCDPALADIHSYSLIDLGGGSLECIQISHDTLVSEQSLPIGSVRVASLLLKDRARPLSREDRSAIANHVESTWRKSNFRASSSPSGTCILTGGAAKHFATILADSDIKEGLARSTFNQKADQICAASLQERIDTFGIPTSRADIFPTAMVTLETSIAYLGCDRLYFSDYNLRFGVAATLLTHGSLTV